VRDALSGVVQHRHEELRQRIGCRTVFISQRPQDANGRLVITAKDRLDAIGGGGLCTRYARAQDGNNDKTQGYSHWRAHHDTPSNSETTPNRAVQAHFRLPPGFGTLDLEATMTELNPPVMRAGRA
jgi:hypothetical protein